VLGPRDFDLVVVDGLYDVLAVDTVRVFLPVAVVVMVVVVVAVGTTVVGAVIGQLAVDLLNNRHGDGVRHWRHAVFVILIFAGGYGVWGLFAVQPVASITGSRAEEGE